jgi:hypothetical protein
MCCASHVLCVAAGRNLLGPENQHNDHCEDRKLERLGCGVEAEAQYVHMIDAQCPGRKRSDHDQQQPIDVQPDDRRGGDADVTEHAMVQTPMCRNDYKANEER